MRFLNGDLEVGEQVVTETMVNALFSFVFSSITWIVKKCGNAVRTKWKESKLQKKDERVVAGYGIYRNAI